MIKKTQVAKIYKNKSGGIDGGRRGITLCLLHPSGIYLHLQLLNVPEVLEHYGLHINNPMTLGETDYLMTQNKQARVHFASDSTCWARISKHLQTLESPLYCPVFLMHGKTEAQRGKVTWSGDAASKWQTWGEVLGSLTPPPPLHLCFPPNAISSPHMASSAPQLQELLC